MKRLLARNIDVNARYPHDLTLLMWASGADEKVPETEAIKVVTYLLDAGAHIDDRDARGRTALMIAAEGGRAEVATLLLARGADPSLKDNAGKEVLKDGVVADDAFLGGIKFFVDGVEGQVPGAK